MSESPLREPLMLDIEQGLFEQAASTSLSTQNELGSDEASLMQRALRRANQLRISQADPGEAFLAGIMLATIRLKRLAAAEAYLGDIAALPDTTNEEN